MLSVGFHKTYTMQVCFKGFIQQHQTYIMVLECIASISKSKINVFSIGASFEF